VNRTHLKNVFWPNIFVGASFQILDIQQYACGLKLGPAAILNQNPIFEIGSSHSPHNISSGQGRVADGNSILGLSAFADAGIL
jgi:hypothetical protein